MSRNPFAGVHAKLSIEPGGETVGREEYLDYMTFTENRRPLFTEIFGPLVGLKEEWAAQGAGPDELNLSAFDYRRPAKGRVPVNTGWMGGREPQLLEENEENIIAIDRMGRKMRLAKNAATLPLPLTFPVSDMDDWLQIKHHYEFSEQRFGDNWKAAATDHLDAGRAVTVSIPGGFDEPRQLLGEQQLCIAFYEQPELVHDILETIGDTAMKVLDRVSANVQVDILLVHEDMAGKSGPLAGPRQVEEFIAPYYARIWEMLDSRGARLFDQDSDGDITPVLDEFVKAGLNCIHPCEPAAGVDVVQLRERYGEALAFTGGIDKHVVRRTKDEIVAELEYKIPPMVATGGCVVGLDHRIPNGTPIENYRFYINRAWEIMNREARKLD